MDTTTQISIRILETINAELRDRAFVRQMLRLRSLQRSRWWRLATTSVSVAVLIVTLRMLSA